MAKRGQMARKPPTTRNGAAVRKRAATAIDPKKEISILRRELLELRQQQTATVEVLKAISHSTSSLEAVLDRLIAAATPLCGADMGILRRRAGTVYELAATHGLKAEWRNLVALHPNTGRHSVIGAAALRSHGPNLDVEDPSSSTPNAETHRVSSHPRVAHASRGRIDRNLGFYC